jgi:hypothetical protein
MFALDFRAARFAAVDEHYLCAPPRGPAPSIRLHRAKVRPHIVAKAVAEVGKTAFGAVEEEG